MSGRYNLKVSGVARTMARAADAAEQKRLGHARCVAHLVYRLARSADLSAEACQSLLLAGLFHDVGWILLASDVARVLGGRDADTLRQHPRVGQTPSSDFRALLSEHVLVVKDFLAPLGLPAAVVQNIGLSHEAWDGSGLPDGLRSGEIPKSALMLAVADQAITLLDQSIGEATPAPQAIASLQEQAGATLEPELTALTIELMQTEGFWAQITSTEAAEPLIDEALYPLFGDFLSLDSTALHQWVGLIGQLADRFHPLADHAAKVKAISSAIAKQMGLSEQEVLEIEIAACLAEVGRVGLPAPIVFRMGAFTEDERQALRAYPTVGERILTPIRAASPIFRGAITHREKLNGTGYPEGLQGEEIPLSGRIIAVADTFVALTDDNAQRPGYSETIAMRILQGEETKLFDGLVTDALEQVVGRAPK